MRMGEPLIVVTWRKQLVEEMERRGETLDAIVAIEPGMDVLDVEWTYETFAPMRSDPPDFVAWTDRYVYYTRYSDGGPSDGCTLLSSVQRNPTSQDAAQ